MCSLKLNYSQLSNNMPYLALASGYFCTLRRELVIALQWHNTQFPCLQTLFLCCTGYIHVFCRRYRRRLSRTDRQCIRRAAPIGIDLASEGVLFSSIDLKSLLLHCPCWIILSSNTSHGVCCSRRSPTGIESLQLEPRLYFHSTFNG